CLSDLRRSVPCKFRALTILAASPRYTASIRFLFVRPALCLQLPSDSESLRTPFAVQLTLPLAGCVEDFHLQVIRPATPASRTAPVTALRAMSGTPKKYAARKSRAARDGGGGGTADPSLSRRAGLCLHPAHRMRGVLSVHRCDES